MSELVLDVAQLRASYGKVQALHDINLKLERGSIATVIGPNGAGKSTLLNAIMGVLPAQGTVRYQGKPVERWSLEQRVMAGIALVPELPADQRLAPAVNGVARSAPRVLRHLSHFGGDDPVSTSRTQHTPQPFLAAAVSWRGIQKVDA